MIAIMPEQIIDMLSILSLVVSSFMLFYILLKYYKGMRTPPFWIYAFAAFLFIAFVSILGNIPFKIDDLILRILRLIGFLLFLFASIQLFKTYTTRIKFDTK
jgi:hypothetical protein